MIINVTSSYWTQFVSSTANVTTLKCEKHTSLLGKLCPKKKSSAINISDPVNENLTGKDCFIIPQANLDRFLPDGVTVSCS